MGEIILQAKNIDKSFSNGKTKLSVLKDFSLDVDVGQIITIMGQSGSGKTTALNILGTLDQADAGELSINGKQVHDMNETELSTIRNRDIGFVFQFHHLLPEFSAIENILMPTWINGADDRRDRALDLIEKGIIDISEIVSNNIPLSKIHDGFVIAASGESAKVIINPDVIKRNEK